MNNEKAPSGDATEPKALSAVLLLSVVAAVAYMDRMALAVLAPQIKLDLQLTDAQLGILIGWGFAIFYAVCGIPIARLADRGDRRIIVATSLAIWSVATSLCGFAQGFFSMLAARIAVGAGEAGCMPPAYSLICDYVRPRRRPLAFTGYNLGTVAGIVLGTALTGMLASLVGWRMTFIFLGVPGIVLAAIVTIFMKEPPRGRYDAGAAMSEPAPALGRALAMLWSNRTYRILVIYASISGFIAYGLNQWWPSFFVRFFALEIGDVALSLGLTLGIGQTIGLLVGGLITLRSADGGLASALRLGGIAFLFAIPAVLAAIFSEEAYVTILCVGLVAMLCQVPNGPAIACIASCISARLRATGGSVQILMTALIGFGTGPTLVGFLSDHFGLRQAMIAPVLLMPVASALLFAASHSVRASDH